MSFGHNSKIRFDEYTKVTFRNIKLYGVRNHTDGNASISVLRPWRSKLVLENSEIHLADNFSFTSGELYMHCDVKICGTSQFNYTSTNRARITQDASWMFDMNTTFSYGPLSNDRTLIKMSDVTSMFFLNGATLKSTTTGMQLTKGTLVLDHKNFIYNEDDKNGAATSVSQAVAFGDDTNDLNIEIMPAATVKMMSGRIEL